jgi:hypothetical protein
MFTSIINSLRSDSSIASSWPSTVEKSLAALPYERRFSIAKIYCSRKDVKEINFSSFKLNHSDTFHVFKIFTETHSAKSVIRHTEQISCLTEKQKIELGKAMCSGCSYDSPNEWKSLDKLGLSPEAYIEIMSYGIAQGKIRFWNEPTNILP